MMLVLILSCLVQFRTVHTVLYSVPPSLTCLVVVQRLALALHFLFGEPAMTLCMQTAAGKRYLHRPTYQEPVPEEEKKLIGSASRYYRLLACPENWNRQ